MNKREKNTKPFRGSEKNAMSIISEISKDVAKLQTRFNDLKSLVSNTPNDNELGMKIRKLFNEKEIR
jgi:capsule polysaccharide export protein KpsE/RkpR